MRPLAKLSLDELHVRAENGRKAVELMKNGTFFKDALVPALEDDMGQLEASLAWNPSSNEADVGKIALDRVWKSGILFGMAKMWGKLNSFKNDGVEAEKELGLREG